MRQIKKRYLWLTFLISLVVGVLIILELSKQEDNSLLLILMVIDFVIMTISLNTAVSRSFKYKPKPKKCVVKTYNGPSSKEIDKNLLKLGFNKKGARFGHGYIKVDGKTAYKIVIIDEPTKYFTTAENIANEAKENDKPTAGIDQCEKFFGFEIFMKVDEEVKKKILDFSFQGKNIFYDGLYFDSEIGKYVEPDHLNPKPDFVDGYNKMLEILKFVEENQDL